MVNVSDLRYLCLEESGDVTVSFVPPQNPKAQMILDARWMPQIQAEIPHLQRAAAEQNMTEYRRRCRDLMAACEGF